MDIINEKDFDKIVTEKKLVLVDFFANWCMPCRMLAPVLDNVSQQVKDFAYVCKVDIDSSEQLAKRFKIFSIPTLLLFKEGKVVETVVGLQNPDSLVQLVKKHK